MRQPSFTAFGPDLGYALNDLDRLSTVRADAAAVAALRAGAGALTVVLVGDQVLLDGRGSPLFPLASPPLPEALGCALLGRRTDGVAVFASWYEATSVPAPLALRDLRGLATEGALAAGQIGALAQAKALIHWHTSHGFCATCGQATAIDQAGWRRQCPTCGALHFPRTDPVVIMMAVRDDHCLLGRQPRFPPGMYSCLAGFVEPGETIEDAVRREIAEEAGIKVGAVRYLGSQPWPFPASLMIGCVGDAETTAIRLGDDELEDARWVSRADLRAILDGTGPDGMTCPPRMAIAHHLMRSWAEG